MEGMRPYLIMNEITPVNVGQPRDMLPLHSTLVHWFWLAGDHYDLTKGLIKLNAKPVRLIPAHEEVFTASTASGEKPVAVTTLECTPELVALHEQTCDMLDELNAVHEKPAFSRTGWRPHITHQTGETVDSAGYVSQNLYVVSAERPEYDYPRTIMARIALLA